MNPRLTRALAELPTLLGILLGWLGLWWLGRAFVLDFDLQGHGWPEYMHSAWAFGRDEAQAANDFRGHLHPALLAWLGERMGDYSSAAILLASTSLAAVVAGAGLAGRALAGAWAGFLAAALVGLSAGVLDATHWATIYPTLAGTTAMALGLGACSARWGRPELALLTGVATAAMAATDPRGLLLVPIPLVLVAWGMVHDRAPFGQRWLRWVAIPLFALPLLARDIGKPPMAENLDRERIREIQKGVFGHWIQVSRDPELQKVCQPFSPSKLLEPATMMGPCGKALVKHNLQMQLPRHLPLGPWAWLGLALVLLPGRRGWRGSVQTLLFFGGLGGAWLVMLSASPTPARYLLQFAFFYALPAAVGLGRLARTLPGPRWVEHLALGPIALLLLGLAWKLDPTARGSATKLTRDSWFASSNDIAALLRSELQEQDRALDCGGFATSLHLAPRREAVSGHYFWWQPNLGDNELQACLDWIQQPRGYGRSLLVLRSQAKDPSDRKLEAALDASGRWVQLDSTESARLLLFE